MTPTPFFPILSYTGASHIAHSLLEASTYEDQMTKSKSQNTEQLTGQRRTKYELEKEYRKKIRTPNPS